jgi:DNA (cytosine-5)-methyltransferase 1
MMRRRQPIGIDLFCGVGGMSLGFEQAGFNIAAAVDSDPIHAATYSVNFPGSVVIKGDVSRLSSAEIRSRAGLDNGTIDVLFGGSPCQGFSTIGKREINDPRNELLCEFARMIRELRPLYFVAENVEGLLRGEARAVLDSFVLRVKRAGYSVVEPVAMLDAVNSGVPQRRRRVFIMGHLPEVLAPKYTADAEVCNGGYSAANSIPNGTGETIRNRRRDVRTFPSVWDAIRDLSDIDDPEALFNCDRYDGKLGTPSSYAAKLRRPPNGSGVSERIRVGCNSSGLTGCLRTLHSDETVRRFTATEPGSYEHISRFYRLTKDGFAPTLRAGTDQSRGSFTAARPIHPVEHRCITVREAARLHSFPDWFRFHPTRWHGFRQVGNSVPPLLARTVAQSILDALIRSGL